MNSPEIRAWLGATVGEEAEDLSVRREPHQRLGFDPFEAVVHEPVAKRVRRVLKARGRGEGIGAIQVFALLALGTREPEVILTWAENGGPPVHEVAEMQGFGSKMIMRTISQQFDGALSYDWQPTGLVVTMRMRKDRLAA